MMLTRSQAAADVREVEYGYDPVGNRTWLLDGTKAPVTRWAVSAVASSSYPGTSAAGAAGPPDVAGCGQWSGATIWRAASDT